MMTTTTDKKDVDINGYVTYYNVPMTKVGVFPYLGRTISPELEPERVYMVLRPEEELTKPETLDSLKNIPFINEHTMLGKDFTPAEDKGIEGTTLENVQVKLPLILNDLKAYTERVKHLIEVEDKRDLSLAYRCRYDLTPGEYNGIPYDAIQRDIRFNHIALVGEGRMGKECRVTDNNITYDNLDINQYKEQNMDLKEEIKEEVKKEILEPAAEEEKTDVTTEEKVIDEPEVKVEDEDTDKRKLIDEIGGILKGKVDDEIIRTIIKKAEELAYNPSETGANDGCGKDAEEEKPPVVEEIKEEKKEEGLSMDAAIKYIAKRDELVAKIRPLIGDNVNYPKMNIDEVVKYACDKLDIKASLDGLEGYLSAAAKHKQTFVSVAKDNAIKLEKKNEALTEYLNGN